MNLSSHPRNMLEFSTSNRKLGVRMNYQVFLIRIIDDVFPSLSKQVTETTADSRSSKPGIQIFGCVS